MAETTAKYAFLGAPYLGGVYTVYRSLRTGLARRGVEVRWVGGGRHAAAVMLDPAWAEEQPHGHAIHDPTSEAATGLAICRHLEEGGYDGVIVNVRMRPVEMNVVRYLDSPMRRIMIVHSAQPGTYGPAAALRPYVHATVGVSPRVRDDLVRRWGFSADRTFAVLNGVDVDEFVAADRVVTGPLRLIYLGRVEERQKGVFWLPAIMERLKDLDVTLTVAGDGPDLEALRDRCQYFDDRVTFTGGLSRDRVPETLAAHDVLLMPSRWEGLGLSLVEAMAAGCVPVVSRLRGVTEVVVRQGEDGLLFPVGDVRQAALHVRELAEDDERRRRMAIQARRTVAERFDLGTMAESYLEIMRLIAKDQWERRPVARDRWSYPARFSSRWRRMVPESVKRWILAR